MDVRDGVSDLKPDDVSILFFERDDLDVRIHSLGFDEEGNVRGACYLPEVFYGRDATVSMETIARRDLMNVRHH